MVDKYSVFNFSTCLFESSARSIDVLKVKYKTSSKGTMMPRKRRSMVRLYPTSNTATEAPQK